MIVWNVIIFWLPQIVAVIVVVWLFRRELLQREVPLDVLKKLIVLIVGIYVLQVFARIILFYVELRGDILGAYLLPGKGTQYFYYSVWNLSEPFVLGLIAALIFTLVAYYGQKIIKKEFFNASDIGIIFLTFFIVGFPSFVVLIFLSLFLMLFIQIFRKLQRREERLAISPFLLISCLILIVVSNFNFYGQFLQILHLI